MKRKNYLNEKENIQMYGVEVTGHNPNNCDGDCTGCDTGGSGSGDGVNDPITFVGDTVYMIGRVIDLNT